MKWGLATLILLIIGAVGFLLYRQYMEIGQLKREAAQDDKLLERREKQKQTPKGDDAQRETGHFHEDGTFHEGEHHDPIEATPSRDYKPTKIQIPKGITDPDVLAAWKRLDYISKNRHKWGQFSPRTLELMHELSPVPEHGSSEYGDSAEDLILVLDELASLRDPRSTELLVNYQIGSGVWGRPIDEALVEMGPASVPALIALLLPTSIWV